MKVWQKLGAWRWVSAGVLGALLVAGGITYKATRAMAADGPGAGAYEQRAALAKDVAKLAIVVMANQTPITQSDAQAVVPVLKEIRDAKMPMSEATAQTLDGKLQAAFTPALQQAVSVVRLPEPTAEQKQRMQEKMRQHAARAGKRNHVRGQMMMKMGMDKLIEFFEQAAKG